MEKHLVNIRELVDENLIVKIVAPSATGKSTLLPMYLGQKYSLEVVVADKNIADALNALKFQNVTYISSKEFLLKISIKNRIFPELLVLDEMDTGSVENFLITSLWKKSKKSGKLVLLSSLPHSLFPDFPTYTISTDKIREIRYIPSVTNLVNFVYDVHNSGVEGDFLIFILKNEIQTLLEKLKGVIKDAEFYSSEKLDESLYRSSNLRKIVVASDMAKTSLTLKNLGVVFDTMLEKRIERTITGGAKMQIQYISKRDADLRAKPGAITYRFISEEEFHDLPEITEELLFRIPLHHLMIDIYTYGLDPFDLLENKDELDFMFDLFLKYNIVDVNYKVTEKGKLLRKLPFGIRTSLLCLQDPRYPTIVLASLIENFTSGIFVFKNSEDDENNEKDEEFEVDYEVDIQKHIREYFEKFRGYSDAHTFLNIFNESRKFNLDEGFSHLKEWCEENFISYPYLKNVHNSVQKASKILNIEVEDFDINEYISSIHRTLQGIYIEKRMNLVLESEDNAEYLDFQGVTYTIDPQSINQIQLSKPLSLYSLINSTLDDTNLISFSYIIEPPPQIEEENIERAIEDY